MSNPSKIKGSKYEAKIRDLLTKELNMKFQRVPLSGSLSWFKGDVFTFNPNWPYAVETKHYEDVEWNNLLTAKSTDIHQFWLQTVREAEAMERKPLLIFRWNRSQDYVGWNSDISLDNQLEVKAFGSAFKLGLLTEWIIKYKATCSKV